MHIHGAYFSNYEAWLTNPLTTYPSAQLVWPIVGQDALNADTSSTGQSLFQGIYITSGFFHLWRSEGGITSLVQLKFIGWTGLLAAHLCVWLLQCTAFVTQTTAHHLFVGVFILAGAIASRLNVSTYPIVNVTRSWNAQPSHLKLSITFAHHIYAIPVYPYLQADYVTVMCLFVHHSWIAGFLFVGAGAHAAIYMVKGSGSR